MEAILKNLSSYYILFIFLALLGIFAIIGYFIEKKHPLEKAKALELDMDAVAKKGTQGLGATLGQNTIIPQEEVEQLDMTMQPTTFINTSPSQLLDNQNNSNSNETTVTNINNASSGNVVQNDINNFNNITTPNNLDVIDNHTNESNLNSNNILNGDSMDVIEKPNQNINDNSNEI